jgi:hypothetical protein
MLTDLKPAEFWEMTLPEWYVYSESYNIKKQEQSDFDILVAWYGVLFNHGKMKYSDVVAPKKQTETQQISALDNVFNRFKAQNGG